MELEILFELAVIMVGAAVLGTLFYAYGNQLLLRILQLVALGPGGWG